MHSKLLATGVALSIIHSAAFPGECSEVYADSTRNIIQSQKETTELGYFYSKHCQKSGEVNNSSFDLGIEATIKQIPFKFSANSASAQQKMEEFCKAGSQQNYFRSTKSDFRDEVVVAALNSFNQCLALQNKGLRISHKEQAPTSVQILLEKTDAVTNVSLDSVTYDNSLISCTSTGFSKDGSEIPINAKQSHKIKLNASVTCKRKAKTTDGEKFYPKASIGLATSVGLYTVELVEDKLYGFTLASQNKKNYENALSERDEAIAKEQAAQETIKKLNNTINNTTTSVSLLSVGEYDSGTYMSFSPREYCYSDPNQHAKNKCGGKPYQVHHVNHTEGNKCGYDFYVITCLQQP